MHTTVCNQLYFLPLLNMSAFYYDSIPQLTSDILALKKDVRSGIDVSDFAGHAESLGMMLHNLNVEALHQRYGDDRSTYSYKHEDCRQSSHETKRLMVNTFHRLSCFLYQCSEGDVPDSTVYNSLRTLQNSIAYHLVSEYMPPSFQWGE